MALQPASMSTRASRRSPFANFAMRGFAHASATSSAGGFQSPAAAAFVVIVFLPDVFFLPIAREVRTTASRRSTALEFDNVALVTQANVAPSGNTFPCG